MTTAHRPTFDHAKGKANTKRSTIQHKRSLPAHKELKYRKRPSNNNSDFDDLSTNDNKRYHPGVTKNSVIELQRELLMAERKEVPTHNHGEDESRESLENRRQRLLVEMKEIDQSSSSSEEEETDNEKEEERVTANSDSSSSSSEEDDEDEEAELLKELEKIRKEKELKKQKEEEIESTKRAAKSNPLLQYQNEEEEFEEQEDKNNNNVIKKSWRSQAVFSRNSTKNTNNSKVDHEFVNDMLKSDFHRHFMERHVR